MIERSFDTIDCMAVDHPRHPQPSPDLQRHEQIERLGQASRVVAQLSVAGYDEAELAGLLSEARSLQRRVDGLLTRIARRADELAAGGLGAPAEDTMRSQGAVGARQARREAARARAAEAMPGLGDALSQGETSAEHADVLASLTADLTPEQIARMDLESLLDQASRVPVETFRRRVKRTVDALTADHGRADAVARYRASEFRHWFDHDTGMGCFAGSLDPERYEALISAIDHHSTALASISDEPLVKDRNLAAAALVELATAAGPLDARSRLPHITVVVDHDTIVHGANADSVRQTANGHDLSPESVARLCCDAVIRKVLLDEQSVPLEVGRTARTATAAQWAALKTVQSQCAWDGCQIPINWCQAHHIREWEHGGPTDLDNLIPLCSRHHHRVHEGQWTIKLLPDRTLEIFRPDGTHHATVDPPRRC